MMLDAILQYKWAILIGFETLAWTATFFMFYARYRLASSFWFRFCAVILALTGVIPQVTMGVINFVAYRTIDVFTLVIVILIIYGFTLGKKDVKRLDQWMKKKFRKKGTSES